MTVEEAIQALSAMEDKTQILWLQEPSTANCFPVNHINTVAMLENGEITEETVDNDYIYPAVLFSSGG